MRRLNQLLLALITANAAILATAGSALCEVRLPAIISDNMMLQADSPTRIWGFAKAGEKVTVKFAGETASTKADGGGHWQVKLSRLAPGKRGTLEITGENSLTVHNVLVGEVWVCSGQSNMAFRLRSSKNAATELPAAQYPEMRLFQVTPAAASTPQQDLKGSWHECTPTSAARFSAVGYFFALKLMHSLNRPVGMIDSCWGGTQAEAWASLEGIQNEPALDAKFEKLIKDKLPTIDAQQIEFSQKESLAQQGAGAAAADSAFAAPITDRPLDFSRVPSVLFNAMIAPLTSYTVRGVIWYQGESNADDAATYRRLFPKLIESWRKSWSQTRLPFIFAQLPNLASDSENHWPELREAQLFTNKSVADTGMAVTIDLGDGKNIHPTNKQPVGDRLALQALSLVYGKHTASSGPICDHTEVKSATIVCHFIHTDGGLVGANGSTLTNFEICGDDHKFVDANATIAGDTVIVSSPKVAHPVGVRYDWADNPQGNFVNGAGLPASPFRSDITDTGLSQ